jgi:hypothetical protein
LYATSTLQVLEKAAYSLVINPGCFCKLLTCLAIFGLEGVKQLGFI